MVRANEVIASSGVPSSGFSLEDLTLALLVGSAVLVVAVAAVRLSARSGLPSLLVYLGIGLVLGERGLGINYENAQLTQVLGYAALVLILVEGGLTTRWSGIRRSVAPAATLATVGVLVSVAVVAVAARLVLGVSWELAALVGAVLASTDAAAVFSVLRRVPLPRRVSGILEAESGFNDAPAVLLVTTLAFEATREGPGPGWEVLLLVALVELLGGAAVGLAVGWAGGRFLARFAPGSSALFALGVVAVGVLAYGAADVVHTSGFLACYLAALVLGNLGLPHRPALVGLSSALGYLAQIGLFVLLGLLADPFDLLDDLLPAVVIGLVLLLLARPISVLVSCAPFRIDWRTQAFLSWAGLRGAVPVVLATVPLTLGTPGVDGIFDLVFVLVVVFTLVQAPMLPWVARRLRLDATVTPVDLAVETTPLEDLGADLLEVTVGPGSRLAGVRVFELRLPAGVNVALVVRDGASMVPRAQTRIERGDQLLVVAPSRTRPATESRLEAVSRDGRLAGWAAADGEPSDLAPPSRLARLEAGGLGGVLGRWRRR